MPCLLLLVIGLRFECITVDPLHCVDQGIASHIFGNTLLYYTVIKRVLGGGTQQAAVKLLHAKLKTWYSLTRCPVRIQGDLTLERLRASAAAPPKLLAKAAQTRYISLFVLEFAMEHFDRESEVEQSIICVVQLLVRVYDLLNENSQFLSAAAKDELPQIGQQLAEQYSVLASTFHEMSLKLWKVAPKLHMWEHLCEFQCLVLGNPRFFWTYPDENLVGQLVEVAESVHPLTLGVSVLLKWLHLIFDEGFADE